MDKVNFVTKRIFGNFTPFYEKSEEVSYIGISLSIGMNQTHD